ncbi:MAG: histidinol-phosphatase HisJ family protein [Butyricicoccus sp.]|nr:histidinol-phosphatase HisJ family protein [Butyricicoccus sp.]
MLVDLHMHSRFSFDAQQDTVPEIAAASIARGLSTIVISDHKDFFWKQPPMELDIAGVQAEIDEARARYGDKIEILKGIELGEPNADPAAMELLEAYPFDTVIGSLHAMPNDIDFYDMDYDHLDQEQLVRDYLVEARKMAEHGGFDVFAHLDYPLRVMKRDYNHPSFENYMEWVTPVLRAIIDRELSFEINAAGLFAWMKHVGPEDFVLDEYRRLGGTMISIGSDSHAAASVGRGIEQCIEHAKKHGFHEVMVYRNRRPEAVAI